MKSYFRLCAPVLIALLIGLVLVGNGFFSTKQQPTAKIQNQAPTERTSRATETAASPVHESLSVPATRETDKKLFLSPITPAPHSIEPSARAASSGTYVAEATLEQSNENGPLLSSNASEFRTRAQKGLVGQDRTQQSPEAADFPKMTDRKPVESRLRKAPRSFDGDVRDLPHTKSVEREMPEHEDPLIIPRLIGKPPADNNQIQNTPSIQLPAAPAPTPLNVFEGLDRFGFGAGSPPDTNGDAGPQHYVQTVNTSIGIYDKVTGTRTAGFTFNALMSQGNFGNLCDTNNFGDPVVVYDTFEDRWIITDFAFVTDGGGNALAPAFQCFAASKTGDPVAGGWNFYSIQLTDNLDDYPKFGLWPDGLYMTANMYSFGPGGVFQHVRVWAFNKAQMYAGAPTVQNVSFNVGGGDFTVIPSNARLQTGTPPAGSPNYFLSTSLFLNALTVYKFHVDWDRISLSTFTGPDIPISATSWPSAAASAAQPGTATLLDTLTPRAMVQNQYTNFGGVESLWVPHTVRRAAAGLAAPRWYQVNVTGGTVNGSIPQAATWDPDGANVINRFMPSLALDRAGNMALGYSTSSTTDFPSIKYAGRLSTDPANTLSLTEQLFFAGTASQTGSVRWGDYSAMTLDPNGCTFWYTTEYANPADQTFNHRWLTKFGSFEFSPCTKIGSGTLQGTVTTSPGGSPISGATVAFGARTTTTDGSGFYSFAAIPAGSYPTETASKAGFNSSTTTNIVVAEAGTTVKDFALTSAPTSACLIDTAQPDFQLGVTANTDLIASPGDIKLSRPDVIDQQNTSLLAAGFAFTTAWHAQTFTSGLTGPVTKVDLHLFSLNCSAVTMPDITVSIRNASGNLPTGADLASATIPGFCNGGGGFFTATFATPVTLTAGTQYAIVWRSTLTGAAASPNPRYVSTVSNGDPYAGGRGASSTDSGGTWTGRAAANNDHGFKVYVNSGYVASGDIVSGAKDSNPPAGLFARWNSLAWTATVPANTTLRFQIAGGNDPAGVFNFIGPDGTAGTFFTTSPASIVNLVNGNRYLKYKAFFTTTDPNVTPTVSDVTVCFNQGPTAANGIIGGRITDANGAAVSGAVVNLTGAQSRKTITDANGNYLFDSVETNGFYSVTPTRVNYHFAPESRSFSLLGNSTDAAFTAMPDAVVAANAIDTPEYFVRQHYLDFLGREPDESGFNFWSDQITSCGSDTACIERRKINVSAAYFLSTEFQQTGGLVDSLYRASYGRRPRYTEFMPDTAVVAHNVIVGRSNWAQILEENKRMFVEAWVQRAAFQSAYGGLTDAGYVDALISNTRVSFSQSERDALVHALSSGGSNRAEVLRQIAENERFVAAKRNESFVMMEYFGYLRREPDPDGYAFWLNKLNQFHGNFEQAEMVKAFIVSGEYRSRF